MNNNTPLCDEADIDRDGLEAQVGNSADDLINAEFALRMLNGWAFSSVYMQRYIDIPDFHRNLVGICNITLCVLRRTGMIRTSELATMINTPITSVTKIIDKLAAIGFVERTRSSQDKRIIFVNLTETCKAKIDSCCAESVDAIRNNLKGLSPDDIRELVSCYEKMNDIYSKLDNIGPCGGKYGSRNKS